MIGVKESVARIALADGGSVHDRSYRETFNRLPEYERERFAVVCSDAFEELILGKIDRDTRPITRQNHFRTVARIASERARIAGIFAGNYRVAFWETILVSIAIYLFKLWWERHTE